MTRDEAIIILRRYREDPADLADETGVELAAALKIAQDDGELQSWLTDEMAFDRRMRQRLAIVTPPPGLKERILSAAQSDAQVATPAMRWALPLALAAAFALAFVLPRIIPQSGLTDERFRSAVAELVTSKGFELAVRDVPMAEQRAWLQTRGAPGGFVVPALLSDNKEIGCQVLEIEGVPITLVCFRHADGRTLHLFVAPLQRIRGGGDKKASVFQVKAAGFLGWSDSEYSYVLADPTGVTLFAITKA